MGIKYFYKWFKDSFPESIIKCHFNDQFHNILDIIKENKNYPFLLLLDLNGIIHLSCQKIFKYGSFKSKCLLKKDNSEVKGEINYELVYKDVLESIEYLINIINPEELVLCIDGVAPISKQIQQRQRRFLTKVNSNGFDSNCISPGTEFLYNLGLYLKLHIKSKMESKWLAVKTVHFMDSLVPGEGEHKLFDFLRSYKTFIVEKKYNIVVHGNDADLILLSLIASINLSENKLYILRDDILSKKYNLICINIFKKNILKFTLNKPEIKENLKMYCIYDFIILSFLVGNDFLPSIPLFNIYDGGLDLLMKYYFSQSLIITFMEQDKLKINFKNFIPFFNHILNIVNPNAIKHYKMRENTYPNKLLDIAIQKYTLSEATTVHYLKAYSLHHNITKKLIKLYLMEIEWILHYYVYGSLSIDWKTYYPSQYAPTPLNILDYLKSNQKYTFELDVKCTYIDPFFQLLCILPPHSNNLLPYPLNKVLCKELKSFHPLKIEVDYDGKLNDWEGICILPPLNYDKILKIYNNYIKLCSKDDLKRNERSNQIMITDDIRI